MLPDIDFTELLDEEGEEDYNEGNYTFKLNHETGEISRELITGAESVEQFVLLALRTPRFEHAIYSDQFGSEVLDLLKSSGIKEGEPVTSAYLASEIERLCIEAIIYDDRVEDIVDFVLKLEKENEVHISFKVLVMGEVAEIEEVLEIDV